MYVCVGMYAGVGVMPRVANIAGKDFTLSSVIRPDKL